LSCDYAKKVLGNLNVFGCYVYHWVLRCFIWSNFFSLPEKQSFPPTESLFCPKNHAFSDCWTLYPQNLFHSPSASLSSPETFFSPRSFDWETRVVPWFPKTPDKRLFFFWKFLTTGPSPWFRSRHRAPVRVTAAPFGFWR